jgi:hypothetical protein
MKSSEIKAELEDLKARAEHQDLGVHRADLLPMIFKFKGKEFSLKDYPQFRELYPDEFPPDDITMSARQIGKTLNLSVSEALDAVGIPYFQQLYVAPLQSQTQRFSNIYLREIIKSSFIARALQDTLEHTVNYSIVKAVFHQTFGNGSGIQLTYAKTSPDRTRGITADRIDFDEVQDQCTANIPIIAESLTASEWALRRYTGTAKTLDNTIEHLWRQSSMDEWVMRCGCGWYNIPNQDGQVLQMISPEGPVCIKCGRLLNVRQGSWVSTYPSRRSVFRGRHIPQLVVPAIVESPVRWSEFLRKVIKNPESFIYQELLGISSSTGLRLISEADIVKNSRLPGVKALQKTFRRDYVATFSGVDWGGAEQVSFTVHTVIGLKPDGRVDVLWAQRFQGFDPDTMLQEIAKAHNFYEAQVLAADYGMGFDKNVMLERRFGIRVAQIMYGTQKKLMNYSPTLGCQRWTVDKVTALEYLFMAIKYGALGFPPYDEFKTYTDDLLSPYEKVIESGGFSTRRFDRDPARPDDFAHALCFAVLVAMKSVDADITDIVPEQAWQTDYDNETPESVDLDPGDILNTI